MGKVVYDFREPIESEKRVYKKEGMNIKEAFYYLGFLLLTWVYTAGFFALFQYAYIFHEPTAFWVYIGIWLAFMAFFLTIAIINLVNYYKEDSEKEKKMKEEEEERKKIAAGGSSQPALQKDQAPVETQQNNPIKRVTTQNDEAAKLNPK